MVRKRTTCAFLSLAFLLLFVSGVVCSEDQAVGGTSAVSHVYVDVDPNIAVNAILDNVDLGSIQVGEIPGTIPFRVDANTEKVRIWGAVTKLYKGDDPDAGLVPPIGFLADSGIEFYAYLGNPTEGQDNLADFIGLYNPPDGIDGWTAYETESIVFESAQPGHFSQQVDMVVHWNQDDPEKPMGEYSGKVMMLAEIVLP
jgi:hypothetical protein